MVNNRRFDSLMGLYSVWSSLRCSFYLLKSSGCGSMAEKHMWTLVEVYGLPEGPRYPITTLRSILRYETTILSSSTFLFG